MYVMIICVEIISDTRNSKKEKIVDSRRRVYTVLATVVVVNLKNSIIKSYSHNDKHYCLWTNG